MWFLHLALKELFLTLQGLINQRASRHFEDRYCSVDELSVESRDTRRCVSGAVGPVAACPTCARLCMKATAECLTSHWEQWGSSPLLSHCVLPPPPPSPPQTRTGRGMQRDPGEPGTLLHGQHDSSTDLSLAQACVSRPCWAYCQSWRAADWKPPGWMKEGRKGSHFCVHCAAGGYILLCCSKAGGFIHLYTNSWK